VFNFQCYGRTETGILPCNASPIQLLVATLHLLNRLVLFFAVHVLLKLSILKYSFYPHHRDFCYFDANLRVSVTCNCLPVQYRGRASLLSSFSPLFSQPQDLLFASTRNTQKMGPRKRTQEEKAKAAQENGFDNDMTTIDDRLVLKEVLPYTKGLYNEQMDTWRA
jgi:hypothetical protein